MQSPATRRAGKLVAPSAAAAIVSVLASAACAQNAPTNLVTGGDIVLGTKTPLGDAWITLPAGTALTNYEIKGEKVRIWEGPFGATVDLARLKAEDAGTAPDGATAAAMPDTNNSATSSPSGSPAEVAAPQDTNAETSSATAGSGMGTALPDWILPAAIGALVAYALLAVAALFRPRRKSPRDPSPAEEENISPVVILPDRPAAKPAVVSDGGRAIACPLCGENIPLEKVGRGRNRCPLCDGTFVGE